jgi:nitronate monooxygenase
MIGTRFLVASESAAFQAYQECLLAAKESNTIITKAFSGRPARGLRNQFIDEYRKSGPQPLAWPFQALAADDIYAAAQKQNNADYFPLLAGQGVGLVKGKQLSAEEMIQELVIEASQTLSKLNRTMDSSWNVGRTTIKRFDYTILYLSRKYDIQMLL